MATLTITSPGVEIREIDLSRRAVVPTGTDVLVLGFANQGPVESVYTVSDINTFQTIYGLPTNAAERYFFYSVKGVLDGGGRAVVSRLPYGSDAGTNVSELFSALWYPIATVEALSGGSVNYTSTALGYVIGKPTLIQLTSTEYESLVQGNFSWTNAASSTSYSTFSDIGKAGFIVANTRKNLIDGDFQGLYVGISDSFASAPNTNFQCITSVAYATVSGASFTDIPETRLNFVLTTPVSGQNANRKSLSKDQETIASFNLTDGKFIDTLNIGVYSVRKSIFGSNAEVLDYVLVDKYVGSLYKNRKIQDPNGGQPVSLFLEDVSEPSPYIRVFVNTNISTAPTSWIQDNGKPNKAVIANHKDAVTNLLNAQSPAYQGTPVQTLTGVSANNLGTYLANQSVVNNAFGFNVKVNTSFSASSTNYVIGNIPNKITRVLQTLADVDAQNIDLSIEAGLGTIYAITNELGQNSYDETAFVNLGNTDTCNGLYSTNGDIVTGSVSAYALKNDYLTIYNQFVNFAENTRKDHLFIADPLRSVFVQGLNNKVLNNKKLTFTQHIFTPLKNLYDTSSTSYATVYADWFLINDIVSGLKVYIPASGSLAGMMAKDDATYAPWFAPAGFTRGKLVGEVLDIAVSPNQGSRDQLYKYGINPITKFPNDGITVFGQKTKLSSPSAFDRINVRRLFLYLEKIVRATMKYFVFEPNTFFTRNQVIAVLKPIFEKVKNQQGMYDYLIVCDERNNTPDVIDRNELIVDIYIKPVRAAEFILVNFYATRTDQNFKELI